MQPHKMEEERRLKPTWAISISIEGPRYVSANKLLVAYEHFMKTISVSDGLQKHIFDTPIQIGSFCTLPELGIIAANDLNDQEQIVVLQYPKMNIISELKGSCGGTAPNMSFLGLELLLLFYFDSKYHFELWKWVSGQKVDTLSVSLGDPCKSSSFHVRPHPIWWHQLVVQSSVWLMFLEVKKLDRYRLELSWFYMEADHDEFKLRMDWNRNSMEEPLSHVPLQECCWLPGEGIAIATSKGIFKTRLGEPALQKVGDPRGTVSSMIPSGPNLFIAYEMGEIDVVDLEGGEWRIKETISVGQTVVDAFTSPDCRYMTVSTLEKGIINFRIDSGDYRITNSVSNPEIGEVVGVGNLGLGLSHCVVAEKKGVLHIMDSFTGAILSNFEIEEEISCTACSPLCSLVLVGSGTGFLYFVDCTTPEKPRIVLCESPYDQPIRQLKFDNFGRYAVAFAEKQPVKIWRASPSSGFVELGSINLHEYDVVKDFTVFCHAFEDSTYLFVLAENGPKKSIVYRFQLPIDFTTQFKQYHVDMFGKLSNDALNFRSLTLDGLYAGVEVCENSLLFFSSYPIATIKRFSIWLYFEKDQTIESISIGNAAKWCLSLNHLWLATVDNFGIFVDLYASHDLRNVVAFTRRLTVVRNIDRPYLEFTLFNNNLLLGKRNGSIMCYGWTRDSQYTQFVPEWISHCFNNFKANNRCLKLIDKEKVDVLPQINFSDYDSETCSDKLITVLQAYVSVMSSKLNKLDSFKSEDDCLIQSVIDIECISELSHTNRQKILEIMSIEETLQEINLNELGDIRASFDEMLQELKSLSSINARLSIDNYCSYSIERDLKLADGLLHYEPGSIHNAENISAIKTMLHDICETKIAFNKEFEVLYATKDESSNSALESQVSARMMSQKLPSKAERDFWTAIVESFPALTSLGSEADDSDQDVPNDKVAEVKKSIIEQLRSSTKVQETFDTSVNALQLKKQFCDLSILSCEVNILTFILMNTIDDELCTRRKETRSSDVWYKTRIQEIRSMFGNFTLFERKTKNLLFNLLKGEHGLPKKIDYISKKEVMQENELGKEHLEQTLNCYFQDKVSSPSESINSEISSISEALITTVPGLSDGGTRCQSFIQTQILIWHLKNLLLFSGEAMQMCWDFCCKLEKNENIIHRAMKQCELLFPLGDWKFPDVFSVLDEAMKENIDNIKKTGFLNSLSAGDMKFWSDIGQKTRKILLLKQRLQEIEALFDKVKKLNRGLSKESYHLKEEHEDVCKILKQRLEEANKAFETAESVYKEFLTK